MFKRRVLKRVSGDVQRLENAIKTLSAEWLLLILKRVLNWLNDKESYFGLSCSNRVNEFRYVGSS